MRILVFFDIHGLHNVYKAFGDLAREHGAELIALVGDHLGCPGGYRSMEEVQRTDAREIIRTPQPHGIPVLHIMGNHERPIDIGSFNFVGDGFLQMGDRSLAATDDPGRLEPPIAEKSTSWE